MGGGKSGGSKPNYVPQYFKPEEDILTAMSLGNIARQSPQMNKLLMGLPSMQGLLGNIGMSQQPQQGINQWMPQQGPQQQGQFRPPQYMAR
jgi:hypothetical protein